MTYTKEELTFRITSLGLGARVVIKRKKAGPYLGAGIKFCNYNEKLPQRFGNVSGSATGYHGEVGIYVSLGNRFSLDMNTRYFKSNIEPFKELINLLTRR